VTSSANSSDEAPTGHPAPACACGPWWRLPALLAIVLVAILLFKSCGVRENASVTDDPTVNTPATTMAIESVVLIIQFNDGHQPQSDKVSWTRGMTVRELLNKVPRINIFQQGSGASAFLTEIDGVKNEGAGGRNWMYSVNGKQADRSFAIYELQPGDQVLWSFAPPQ
jgi:hypothetical protein